MVNEKVVVGLLAIGYLGMILGGGWVLKILVNALFHREEDHGDDHAYDERLEAFVIHEEFKDHH